MNPTVKTELTSVTNWLGGAAIAVGNVLPYVTPDTLTALGFTAPWVKGISTAVGLILIAYREKSKATPPPVVPPTPPETPK